MLIIEIAAVLFIISLVGWEGAITLGIVLLACKFLFG